MRFITVENYEQLSTRAADIIASVVTLKPNCVLGLATVHHRLALMLILQKNTKKVNLIFQMLLL